MGCPSEGSVVAALQLAATTLWWWRMPRTTRTVIAPAAAQANQAAMPAMVPTVDQAKALRRRPRRVSPLKSVFRWPVRASASACRAATSSADAPLDRG